MIEEATPEDMTKFKARKGGGPPSNTRIRMDLLDIGSGCTIKNEPDMTEAKRRAQVIASNLRKTGKRFSVRWLSEDKDTVRVVRTL